MASISSPGLGSGLDINGIIAKLMAVESQPLTTFAKKEASFQAKLSALGSLKGALSTLQTAVQTLKNPGTFTGMTATSSDTAALTASASSAAAAGTHSISITQLAKYHSVRSDTNYAASTDTFTTGTLSITIGTGTAVNVTIDNSNNTLAGISAAINAARAGVTASVINADIVPPPSAPPYTTNRLVLTSQTLGSAGAITVAVTDSGSGGTNALANLASASLVTTQGADNARLTIDNLPITRSSNTITDAVAGVTLNLLKEGGSSTVKVTQNTSAVASAINAFVKAYNDAIGQIKTLTAYDAANKKASALTGDSTARSIEAQLSRLVGTAVSGVSGGISLLSDLGIAIQRDGKLASDTGKLSAALADKDKDVAALFSQTTTGNEGIAVRFNTMLEGIIGTAGLISSRTDGINASIKDIQKRGEAFQNRLAQIESRYRKQFSALDSLVASMNQTSNYLSQQLANLPGAASKK
jgi:flagellar hook-associated protein 2